MLRRYDCGTLTLKNLKLGLRRTYFAIRDAPMLSGGGRGSGWISRLRRGRGADFCVFAVVRWARQSLDEICSDGLRFRPGLLLFRVGDGFEGATQNCCSPAGSD